MLRILLCSTIISVLYMDRLSGFGLGLDQEELVVSIFRDYLRIPTDHPNPWPGYEKAVDFLMGYSSVIGLNYTYFDLEDPADFAFWISWEGSDPSLKSVLLNTHMDVVAVDPEKWTYPPFDAYKDENGDIYARGATDDKAATIAIFEAIRRLKLNGFTPLRTVHVAVMPDEEKGGRRGMKPFVKTDAFKNLNVGADIDEGGVNSAPNVMQIRYAEKSPWQFNISARGEAAHGSTLPEFTAGQRLQAALDQLLGFRKSQFDKLQDPNVSLGDLTVLNLVRLGGGLADNIIPNEVWASFDMRIRLIPGWNFFDVEAMLNNVVEESRLGSKDDPSNEVFLTFIQKSMESGETVADDSNPWWTAVQDTCLTILIYRNRSISCPATVANAATDGRYTRDIGIPTFGIGPFLNTPYAAHQDDEKINEVEFFKGIERYEALIRHLSQVPGNIHP